MLFDLEEETTDEDILDIEEEEAVEAEAFPPAEFSSQLFGHLDIEKKLLHMIDTGRFPHGLIFSGPEGVGKSVMAFRLTRFLFTEKEREADMFGAPPKPESLFIEENHPIFSKIANGGHPDLLVIRRPVDQNTGQLKSTIPVEEIRRIAPFMRKTASVEGGWRIVIVDDADMMTRSSQNSLLKILEEPPEKALLVLIAHRAGALLPTVFSRCVHLPFPSLSSDIIDATLAENVPQSNLRLITALAEGSLGRAIEYSAKENYEIIEQTLSYIENWPNFNWAQIQTFADQFGTKGNDHAQRIFRQTLLWVASSVIRGHSHGIEILEKLIANLSIEQKLKIHDTLSEHFGRCIGGNLDKRFMIMGAYMALEA